MANSVKNPFIVGNSSVYGWCVYDSRYGYAPAYEACADLLPPIVQDEYGAVCETPVLLRNKAAAMNLKNRLFKALLNNA